VRAVAVGVIASKAAPQALEQNDRTRLLLDSLADPAPAVRSAARALALRWLAACDQSLPALAALAGPMTDPESERAASFAVAACMEAASRGSPPAEAKAARVGSAGAAPIRTIWKQAKASIKAYRAPSIGGASSAASGAGTVEAKAGVHEGGILAPEAAIVWRVRCDWLAGRGTRQQHELEACLPGLSTLAVAIKSTVDEGGSIDPESESQARLGDFAQEMSPELSFVLRQLLALCSHADWGDEAGRSRVEQVLVHSVLPRPGVPDGALFGVTGALLLAMGGDHAAHAGRVLGVARALNLRAESELREAGGEQSASEDVAENCALATLRVLRIVSALLGGTQASVGGLSSDLSEAMQGLVCPAVASPYPAVRGAAVRCLAADAVLRLGAANWAGVSFGGGNHEAESGPALAWAGEEGSADTGREHTDESKDPTYKPDQQAALEAAATALEVACRGIASEEDECRLEAARGALDIVCALPFPVAGARSQGTDRNASLRERCATAGRRLVLSVLRVALEHAARPAHARAGAAAAEGAWRVRLRASIVEGLARAVLSGRLHLSTNLPSTYVGTSAGVPLDVRAIRTLIRVYCADDSIGAEAAADACSERAAAAFESFEDMDEAADEATEAAREAEMCLAADARMRQVVGSSLPAVADMGEMCRKSVAEGASLALRALMDGSRADAASVAAAEALDGSDPTTLSAKKVSKVEVAARAA